MAVSDRHFGIGGDGLILIMPSERADARMRMFNADGSEGEMCGNGVRCVAKYSTIMAWPASNKVTIETGRGVLTLDLEIAGGTRPAGSRSTWARRSSSPSGFRRSCRATRRSTSRSRLAIARWPSPRVSMGNPHAVIYVDDVAGFPLESLGPRSSITRRFPGG